MAFSETIKEGEKGVPRPSPGDSAQGGEARKEEAQEGWGEGSLKRGHFLKGHHLPYGGDPVAAGVEGVALAVALRAMS